MALKPAAKREFKARLFGEFARIGRAFSSPHRLRLIEVLAQAERTVEQLAKDVGSPVANVSQHLQVLRSARLVAVRKDGPYARYSLADPEVFRVWQAMRDLGRAQLTEVEAVVIEFLGTRSDMEAVDVTELRRRLKTDDVTVLDVRPSLEYEAGHIRGARNIPFDELKARLREIPQGIEIVAYCRGPYCVFADEAVEVLRARGFRARRLTEGYPDWRSRGFAIETGTATSR
jgi:rhodanese-related sulfurtransferase